MRAEFVNPFLEAATLVYRDVLGTELIRGKLRILESPAPSHELAIIVGVIGPANGEVIYSLNFDTAFKMAKKLVPSLKDGEVENEYKDIIGEIANMVTGNAMSIFNATGQFIDITTPNIVETKDNSVKFGKKTTLSVNLYSKLGSLEVNISLT
ncbi:MAG: chemotaxis protein CheX [Leptospiraceae bacterium]|nr:chemotaxis protein CheX [Leptospiraceae bacterium]MCK6381742.1 chemotaxis protein CheX [Leptospiraceae bacterium]NUM42815.1 chemotaxis protein CheX [Leptospiraceae bacterium]